MMPTTTSIPAVDETDAAAVANNDRKTFNTMICNGGAMEVLLYVYATSGRLGVVIDMPNDGMLTIRSVMEDSPLI